MKNQQVKRMENGQGKEMKKGNIELPEEIWLEIVTRLPFRHIMRLKTVCKGLRTLLETEYFRRAFMFAHRNSSSSWSIMHQTSKWSYGEVVGLYGCERYGIPRSLNSYIPSDHDEMVGQITIIACVDGLVLIEDRSREKPIYSVGNPVLNQWIKLPPHPSKGLNAWVRPTSLVTRVDEDGMVVEYKVVFMNVDRGGLRQIEVLRFEIYSSETGKWVRKQVSCPRIIVSLKYKECLSLNKRLYWIDKHGGAFVTYDFFVTDDDEQQQCQFILFPSVAGHEFHPEITQFDRAYSTSGGFLIYMSIIEFQLRLWRFEEYNTSDSASGRWQLRQEINTKEINRKSLQDGDYYFPVAMHPFENNIIFMGNWERRLVSMDLKTYELTDHTKSTYSNAMFSHYFDIRGEVFYIPQFILPKYGWAPSLLLPSV